MSLTFQFKLLLALAAFIAVMLIVLQLLVIDKIPERDAAEFAAQLKTFNDLKENSAKFGNSTNREFAREIAERVASLDDKKLMKAIRKIYRYGLKSQDENKIYFYDSLYKPVILLNSASNFNEQTRTRDMVGYSEIFRLDSATDFIQEIDQEFVDYLLAVQNYPIVFSYYWRSESGDLHATRRPMPLMIELSAKYQNKSELIRLYNRSYLNNLWHLKDTTANLVFQSNMATDTESEIRNPMMSGASSPPTIHKDQIYLYRDSKKGKIFLIRWEGIYPSAPKEIGPILFSLRWISSKSSSVMEDRKNNLRVFVGQDDVSGLTEIYVESYETNTNFYVLHYGIGLGFIFVIAFFIYIIFWQILSHVNYFAQLSEEFTVSVEQGKTEEKLMDYYHSVLDFYYSILSKFIPKYRQKNIKEVFQFNLNEFSKIVADMIQLRDHLEIQVAQRTNELQQTVHNLKETQAQLVQSEKMALLGQLTAGIAHEIKNPLNFVNNFAQLSAETASELKSEFESGNLSHEDLKRMIALTNDLIAMMQKISEHGKRADSIVKGMLLHARTGSAERVPTDLNALLDEYLKLSYHGFRARDKSFNIAMPTDYDASIPTVHVVPQDLSRVFMNIITNGCYAAYERKKEAGDSFSPEIRISTKNLKDKIEIRIRDNGRGIPENLRDKMFSPFFTTKPIGEGTGLGLSLSYDIVVHGHAGELKFESVENEFTEFIILLPIKWHGTEE